MKSLCIHLEDYVTQLPVPPEVEWLITVEFVKHLKKKWPDVYCHVMDENEKCDKNY